MKTNLLLWLIIALLTGSWSIDHYFSNETSASATQSPLEFVSAEEDWARFETAELLSELQASGRPYLPFLQKNTLSTGLYRLENGATDHQEPHTLDEVYYTLSGSAKFEVEGDEMEVQAGTILFVRAGASHRFKEISEDLELLVFFSKASQLPKD